MMVSIKGIMKKKRCIGDSLVIKEGDYATIYSPDSYYGHFKWDSVLALPID